MLLCWWDSFRGILAVAKRGDLLRPCCQLVILWILFPGSRSTEYAYTQMTVLHIPWLLAGELF